MVELDDRWSAAKTLANKMQLKIFVLFNIYIAGLHHILSLQCLFHFYSSVFVQ